MSHRLITQDDNLLWDDSDNSVGQPTASFDLAAIKWHSLDFDGLISGFPGSTGQLPEAAFPQQNLPEGANGNHGTISGVTHRSVKSSAEKSRASRNCRDHDQSDQSALEVSLPLPFEVAGSHEAKPNLQRRRTQVRLAQRAYRNREKNLISTLQKDVDDLRSRLIGMQNVTDDWFRLMCSIPALSEETKRKAQSLRNREGSYRLSSTWTPVKATSTKSDVPSALDNQGCFRPSQLDLRLLPDPAIRADDFSIAFWLRLRDDALKGAHHLIATPETPYNMLLDKFRYCIFVSTREQIKTRLEILIHNTCDFSYQFSPCPVDNYTASSSPPLLTPAVVDEEECRKQDAQYVDVVSIVEYLSERGLNVDPRSPYAEFSMSPQKSFSPIGTTIFEESRQREKIRISVNKLRHGELPIHLPRMRHPS